MSSNQQNSSDIGAQYAKLLQEKSKKELNAEELRDLLGSDDNQTETIESCYRITLLDDNKIKVDVLKGDPIIHFNDAQLKMMDDYALACCGERSYTEAQLDEMKANISSFCDITKIIRNKKS